MKRTKFTRVAAFALATVMAFGALSIGASASAIHTNGTTAEELASTLSSTTYATYLTKHSASGLESTIVLNAADALNTEATTAGYKFDTIDGKDAVVLTASGMAVWNLHVDHPGMYTFTFEYNCVTDYAPLGIKSSTSAVERIFYINGKVPFSEARDISFTKTWKYDYVKDEDGNPCFEKDLAGNEIRPNAVQVPVWKTAAISDADGFYTDPFQFYLEEGDNTIALEGVKSAVAFSGITIAPVEKLKTYEEYYAALMAKGYTYPSKNATLKIEAELPTYISDTSIYAANESVSPAVSPQSAKAQLRNVIGTAGYDTVGQWASYDIQVSESGLYKIGTHFQQSTQSGIFCSRLIRINGEIPFAEAYNTRFDYSSKWQTAYLGDGENEFVFYFEAGKTYNISLEVSLGEMRDILNKVETSLNAINNDYLEILKLTGADPDTARDYDFGRIMPDSIRNLLEEYITLTETAKYLEGLCGTAGSNTGTLKKVAQLLYRMGSNEDKIASNLENLKSNIGTLGTWLNDTKEQPITLDYIIIQSAEGTKLPKANANFFKSIGFHISSFIMTFFRNYDSMGATVKIDSDDTIEVWLSDGRDQATSMRTLIDNHFINTYGIGVNLKLVTAGTLLPSVLAGSGPDTYLGLAGATALNYAIRSAVIPLDGLDGLDETLSQFVPAAIRPLQLYGKTYGIPKNMSFHVMFYRQDVLSELGLGIPETWDDLMKMVPVLQANNMGIGMAKGTLGIFDILLYQRGGSRWDTTLEDEGMKSGLDSDVALDVFNYYCRFYTMYSFDVTFDASNRFRTGEMPVIIDDYRTLYNKLIVFATEIRGLWSFAPMPGTILADGTINNDSCVTVTGVVMMNGVENKDDTWEFMKWFVGPEIQSAYGNEMVSLLGPSAKYNSANIEALQSLDWNANEQYNLQQQIQHLSCIVNYPGNYIVERYENFAFLAAYNDSEDPVEQLQSYVVTINKEISRKRQEFDLETYEDFIARQGN